MNKSQLINELAISERLTYKKAELILNTLFGSIAEGLAQGDRVEIRGFGSFKVKSYDGYMGRNPKSGKSIDVKAKKLPFFKVGKELKKRIDT